MRLVFFGLSITSSWGNGHATTYRGLLRGLQQRGHRLHFFERDAEWYARHRDLRNPPQTHLTLYSNWPQVQSSALAAAREADAVIVGSYFPDAVRLLDDLLGRTGPLVCFYDIDTPITLQTLRAGTCAYLRAGHIPALDLYLSFTGGPVLAELERVWGARQAQPLYCACDENAYGRARRSPDPRIALSFLGTYAPDRQAKLQRLLLAPARTMPKQHFQVAGSMYPQASRWPANVRYDSHLPPAQHPAFYAASRFTLNMTRQAMVEAGYSPSVRLFEAAAAATPVISDPWPGLAEFFIPGEELLVAYDTGTVVSILSGYTAAQAARIGRAAQEHVLAAHTCDRRAQQLEGYLAEAPAHPSTRCSVCH